MVFSSLLFLFRFLPLVLAGYYLVPARFRNLVLLLFSLAFYAWGEPVYILLMITTILIGYACGRGIESAKKKGRTGLAKGILLFSLVSNLMILGVFKYADFTIRILNGVAKSQIPLLKLGLPVGISFYTFQTLSYTIDVYRGDAKVQNNPIYFGTYVTMFPQLIAGPIVTYRTIEEQLQSRKESFDEMAYGIHRFMIGLGKKVLLANQAGLLWNTISGGNLKDLPAATAWIGIAAYTFHIYFDFSGYSDMAIGMGHMFGFTFLENFNYPYISKSVTEFWRRWHISLSTWFRDYVYIPLGGNRCSVGKHIRNIFLVWMLTGIWHGAEYNFILWGLYYGILLLLEKYIFGKYLKKLPSFAAHLLTMILVMFGWCIFAFTEMTQMLQYFAALFGGTKYFANRETLYLLWNYGLTLLILAIGSTRIPSVLAGKVMKNGKNPVWLRTALAVVFYMAIFLLSVAFLVDATFNPFLYFRF